MMNARWIFMAFMSAALGSVVGILVYEEFFSASAMRAPEELAEVTFGSPAQAALKAKSANKTSPASLPTTVPTLWSAAQQALPSVVYIRTQKPIQSPSNRKKWWDYFFDTPPNDEDQSPSVWSTGSGVILSQNGYIITNQHVIDEATEIEIILHDNRAFVPDVVGTSLDTDLALLKINTNDLTPIPTGDSDALTIGEWVIAVGNPFRFRSTVTAGIVSAKHCRIDIVSSPNNLSVESFIQTDAVVNRGSSGGALVNTKGELVGLNTAIFTETGHYAGYSFAVPAALVLKVAEDLRIYGEMKRAMLGVSIVDMNAELAKVRALSVVQGVSIEQVHKGSAAHKAGLKEEDIIIQLDQARIRSVPELQEYIARRRPGDQVQVTYVRGQTTYRVQVRLRAPDNA